MGNCCRGQEEVDESQLMPETIFYDPQGNCYLWDDVQQISFTKLNTLEHFTRDEYDPKLFYNDEDPTMCLNVGGDEESYYVPNKKVVEPEIDTDVTDSSKQKAQNKSAPEGNVTEEPKMDEEADNGIDEDDGDGGIEGETAKKFMKVKKRKQPKSNQRYKSKKTRRVGREKQLPLMGRMRGRGRLFRKVKITPPIRFGLQRGAKSRKGDPTKRRKRTLKKQGGPRLW